MGTLCTLSKDVIRVRTENKNKRKNKKTKDVQTSSVEHINLSSSSPNIFFLSESSDTLNDNDLIELSKHRLTHTQKT